VQEEVPGPAGRRPRANREPVMEWLRRQSREWTALRHGFIESSGIWGCSYPGLLSRPTQVAGNQKAVITRAEREASGPHPIVTP